jgi:glycerol-3-phosphate dehydrogenase
VSLIFPIIRTWKIPYYWVGAMVYDILAGKKGLSSSYFMSKEKALETFPTLKSENLKGAIVYYDGC